MTKTKPVCATFNFVFLEELIIEDKNRTILKAKSGKTHLKLWYDGSKLDKSGTEAAVVWKNDMNQKKQEKKLCLGLNKEIFDAKI